MSRKHLYRIRIDHIRNADGSVPENTGTEFDFESHDELLAIIDNLGRRPDIGPALAPRLGLGIKLFGGVMLEKRTSELFAGLFPHFAEFMKKLKGKKR